MPILERTIQKSIENKLFKKKIIIVYGARQVGKTTLIKTIQKKYQNISLYLNCDEPDIRDALTNASSTEIKAFIGDKKLIFLDEAQRVKNIGLTLKLICDNFPEVQIVATGSSSFDLSNKINEPLTGRKYEFYLHPFSMSELGHLYSPLELRRLKEKFVLFGMYPEVIFKNNQEAQSLLRSLSNSYLYKDILQFQNIKNPEILEKLLQALALQIGNEVSYNELASTVGIDKKTVANYLQILEKSFIIFRLGPFSRNLRTELKKLRKIYFYDTGLRNALINNFNPFSLRQDTGALWENFLICERMKKNNNNDKKINTYFWRTHNQNEIDYLEESEGQLRSFEIKWKKNKKNPPKDFIENYPNSSFQSINQDNFLTNFL